MKNTLQKFMAALCAICILSFSSVMADEGDRYASFRKGADTFAAKIDFPVQLKQPLTVVICRLLIGQDGYVYSNICQSNVLPDGDIEKLEETFAEERMMPARVDGRKLSVLQASYSVYFINEKGKQSIIVTENLGLNIDQYGDNYQAPQLIRYNSDNDKIAAHCDETDEPVYATLTVSAKGRASDIAFQPEISDRQCEATLKKHYRQADFLPGKSNGRAVEMKHVVWFARPQSD